MRISEIILLEDENLIAINKPAGLLSVPDREGKEISLKKILQEKFDSIYTVHRLDKETSGVIVFAKNEKAHKDLSLQFENRKTEKIYYGLVVGSPSEIKGSIQVPIAEHPVKKGTMTINRKGKPSHTDYEVEESYGLYAWVKFQIHTGRTHQIRVHCKNLGYPIVCDPLYGDGKPILLSSLKHKKFKLSKNEEEERPLMNRLALHAYSLSFEDQHGKKIMLQADIPKDLIATMKQIKKWTT